MGSSIGSSTDSSAWSSALIFRRQHRRSPPASRTHHCGCWHPAVTCWTSSLIAQQNQFNNESIRPLTRCTSFAWPTSRRAIERRTAKRRTWGYQGRCNWLVRLCERERNEKEDGLQSVLWFIDLTIAKRSRLWIGLDDIVIESIILMDTIRWIATVWSHRGLLTERATNRKGN